MSNVDSITIRMYNTGSVGDCLFLQFLKNKEVTFSMLIDCGGFNTPAKTITMCADDIKKKLNGKPLDLVVVTHEHLDHVSGFNQARSVFDTIQFSQIWMAWTEDPSDALANKLKTQLGKKLAALTKAVENSYSRLKKRTSPISGETSLKSRLSRHEQKRSNVLEALRFESGMTYSSTASALTVSQAMSYVKGKSKSKEKMYKKPGDVISNMNGAEGIKFFILGPPYDQNLSGIRNTFQTDEVYSFAKHLAIANGQAFLNAISGSGSTIPDASPFNRKYRMTQQDRKAFETEYNSSPMRWRQIEEDWLDVSGEIAIAVNTYTNNTSLAMAIEFADTNRVLLFPADAQSGNWISWHDQTVMADLKRNGGKDAEELLSQTAFYKVGHHGSHNGTASVLGLDKIKGENLVAMIPLVQDKIPSQWGGSKNFPAKALYTELITRTNGAIIRTDEGLIRDDRAVDLRGKYLSSELNSKLAKVNDMDLYREWTVEAR